jgi:hypothetical protein
MSFGGDRSVTQRAARDIVRLIVSLALILCGLGGFAPAIVGSRIIFAGGIAVPRSVQDEVWSRSV